MSDLYELESLLRRAAAHEGLSEADCAAALQWAYHVHPRRLKAAQIAFGMEGIKHDANGPAGRDQCVAAAVRAYLTAGRSTPSASVEERRLLESIENLRGHRVRGVENGTPKQLRLAQESYLAHVEGVFQDACALVIELKRHRSEPTLDARVREALIEMRDHARNDRDRCNTEPGLDNTGREAAMFNGRASAFGDALALLDTPGEFQSESSGKAGDDSKECKRCGDLRYVHRVTGERVLAPLNVKDCPDCTGKQDPDSPRGRAS